MNHHAFVVEAGAEEGVKAAEAWVEKELGMKVQNNPDIIALRYGLLSVEDARGVYDSAVQAPFVGEHKVIIIAADRVYHEAQNALLKLFEEPPRETYLFLILPSLGGLLPTLRSRVHILNVGHRKSYISEVAKEFLEASREKRTSIIKRITSGKDEDERREGREEAIAILNGIEALAYGSGQTSRYQELLEDIQVLRGYLYDRSAPVRMILEHLSLVLPKDL